MKTVRKALHLDQCRKHVPKMKADEPHLLEILCQAVAVPLPELLLPGTSFPDRFFMPLCDPDPASCFPAQPFTRRSRCVARILADRDHHSNHFTLSLPKRHQKSLTEALRPRICRCRNPDPGEKLLLCIWILSEFSAATTMGRSGRRGMR